ncbi:MAG: hypothetical protein NVS3B20_13660 [Polyangiales bacterium]
MLFAQAQMGAAENASQQAIARLPSLFSCDVTKSGEDACAQQFVDTMAPLTFRRPITDGERARLIGVYAGARQGAADYPTALGWVIQTMLMSPYFLFRTEYGGQRLSDGKTAQLNPYETASMLSYFLWRSAPDAQLFTAAAKNELATPEQMKAQTVRMLKAPRARDSLRSFFLQWLQTNSPDALTKPDPTFTPALGQAMVDEMGQFFDQTMWSGDASLNTLMTSTHTFANASLAKLYGITGPRTTELEPVTLDSSQRSGFLTQPGFIAAQSSSDGNNPIFPGKFVRMRMLCQPLPPPPPGVPQVSADASLSARQRYSEHSKNATCQGCHHLMDPIGFGFERYDALGRFRTKQGNFAVTGQGPRGDRRRWAFHRPGRSRATPHHQQAGAQLLQRATEGTGSMLDNTIIVVFTEIGKGHTNNAINIVTVGGKNLGVKTGQYLHFGGPYPANPYSAPTGAPHNRLLVSLLQAVELTARTFGDTAATGSGPLAGYRV